MVKTIVFNREKRSFESAPMSIGCRGCASANARGNMVNSALCDKLGDCTKIIYKEVTKEQDMTTKEAINMTDKYRTRDGDEVRVLCIDAVGANPVVALRLCDGEVSTHTAVGYYWLADESGRDLIKVCPYADFKKGDRVIAGTSDDRRIFSHVESGKPHCFKDGGDEWTSNGRTSVWSVVRKPTAEELLA